MEGFDASVLHTDCYRRAPEPVWQVMREDHPLVHDPHDDVWWLTRYADVAAVFADHENYSAATYEGSTGAVLGPTLISRDDQGHVVRRSLVAPDFVGGRLDRTRPLIESCASTLIDRFAPVGSADLVADLTTQLPVDVIAAMLGMTGDGGLFRRWVTDMIQGLAPIAEMRERGIAAHRAFCSHLAPALTAAEDPDRHDLIAKIARAEVDGQRLDHDEIVAFCGLLFIAGGETTDKAMASMWWQVLRQPDLLEVALDDPEHWHALFTETMRRWAPVITEDRFTRGAVEWYGVEIPEGARVRVCIGSANLDPTVFADPERFDPDRGDLHCGKELRSGGSTQPGRTGHLGFGLGKHFCLGYELARTEAVIGSRLLAERCRDISPIDAVPPPAVSRSFRAVAGLPVRFTPEPAP